MLLLNQNGYALKTGHFVCGNDVSIWICLCIIRRNRQYKVHTRSFLFCDFVSLFFLLIFFLMRGSLNGNFRLLTMHITLMFVLDKSIATRLSCVNIVNKNNFFYWPIHFKLTAQFRFWCIIVLERNWSKLISFECEIDQQKEKQREYIQRGRRITFWRDLQ